MAGATPYEAYTNYLDPLRLALGCITSARLTISGQFRSEVDVPQSLSLNQNTPVRLRGPHRIDVTFAQRFCIVQTPQDDPRGPYKVSTLAYFYVLSSHKEQKELLTYHWDRAILGDGKIGEPHLHIGPGIVGQDCCVMPDRLHKAHIPTERISAESFIRLAIEEFQVRPLSSRWSEILESTEAKFIAWKTR